MNHLTRHQSLGQTVHGDAHSLRGLSCGKHKLAGAGDGLHLAGGQGHLDVHAAPLGRVVTTPLVRVQVTATLKSLGTLVTLEGQLTAVPLHVGLIVSLVFQLGIAHYTGKENLAVRVHAAGQLESQRQLQLLPAAGQVPGGGEDGAAVNHQPPRHGLLFDEAAQDMDCPIDGGPRGREAIDGLMWSQHGRILLDAGRLLKKVLLPVNLGGEHVEVGQ